MRNIYLFVLSLFFVLLGCSTDSDGTSEPFVEEIIPENYVYLNVNDAKVFNNDDNENLFVNNSVYLYYDLIIVGISYGKVGYLWNDLGLTISKEGELISAGVQANSATSSHITYGNYKNFPLNYFTISDFEIDEVTSKVHFKLDGKLYLNRNNLSSESMDFKGEVKASYESRTPGVTNSYFFSNYGGLPQYCNAKLNNVMWTARFEPNYGVFTSADPYKIEIYFNQNLLPGSYDFTNESTAAFIKFSKFNTTTLVFDYYDVVGVVSHSYREFHGANKYSFVGTYNFTATNPNNPSDVIQVTDGNFTSFQQY